MDDSTFFFWQMPKIKRGAASISCVTYKVPNQRFYTSSTRWNDIPCDESFPVPFLCMRDPIE